MRLAKFIIRRFKGIDELTFTMPSIDDNRTGSADFLTILGENNRCKSSVLEALRLAFPHTEIKKPTREYFPNGEYAKGPIEIELHFELNKESTERNHIAIKTNIYKDNEFRIRKRWKLKDKSTESASTEEDQEQKIIAEIEAFREIISIPNEILCDIEKCGFIATGEKHKDWKTAIDSFLKSELGIKIKPSAKATKTSISQFEKHVQEKFVSICERVDRWELNPGGISANPDSVMPRIVFLPAFRDLNKDADPGAANSTAQKLFAILFNRHLASDARLQNYHKATEDIQTIFNQQDEEGPLKNIQRDISSELQKLINLEIELQYSPPKFDLLLQSTTMLITDQGTKTSIQHQGHGAQRAILLALLELFAKHLQEQNSAQGNCENVLILCEEPEIYLHPQMCRRMRDVLVALAKTKKAQVICTTHSPVFLDLADRHDGIAILCRERNTNRLFKRPKDIPKLDTTQDGPDRLRMLLDFDPAVNELFFAGKVILVEGDSEVAAYKAIIATITARKKPPEHRILSDLREIVIVNCRGKDTIPAIQRVLNAFDIDYYVIHDRDKEADSANETIKGLIKSDNQARLLIHDKNFEDEIMRKSVKRRKPWEAYHWIRRQNESNWPVKLLVFFRFIVGENLYADLSMPVIDCRLSPVRTQQSSQIPIPF